LVPTKKKNELWRAIKEKYIFPPQFLDRGEKDTLYVMGKAIQTFKRNLNKDYVQKGLTPFKDLGFITPDDWTTLVNQRTPKKALEVSKNFEALSKQRKCHPNLGLGSYKAKIEE
jgi:ssDNA-specific exonuclease RecJ